MNFDQRLTFLLCTTIGLAACGSQTAATGPDASTSDGAATDAATDAKDAAAFEACFDTTTGGLLDTLKACAVASDCTTRALPQCCGIGYRVVGVATSQAGALDVCLANMPDCGARGCASMPGAETEDGKIIADGGAARVDCVSKDGGARECWSSAP